MTTLQNNNKERFHFLDGIRGIASFLIVLHHSVTSAIARFFVSHGCPWLATLVTYFTQSGVVLFFVLSGVVLLRPYLRGQRQFKTGEYFYRRIRRIYPPFFVALLFGYLVAVIIKSGPETYYSSLQLWKWTSTSWQELLRQSFIINYAGIYYNLAWWSLQVEVIFYFLVPLLVVFFVKQRPLNYIRVFSILFAALALSYLLQQYVSHYYPSVYKTDGTPMNMMRILDAPVAFLLGIFLAKYDMNVVAARILVLFGGLLIVLAGNYGPMINSGYSFLYAGVIILAFNNVRIQQIFDSPIMIWLGERSYSLFLVHFSVFYLVDYICSLIIPDRSFLYGALTRGIGIPLSLFCAMLLFHFVERKQARGLVTGHIFWPWQANRILKENSARK
jgi:peptidoglycan/LPS O-acetylase OafA/YrhL